MGFNVTQVYGLTEVYGPATECTWQEDRWGDLTGDDRAAVKARQGVAFPNMDHITVMDPRRCSRSRWMAPRWVRS
jgi:fatty-acyl-CoA synthase